MELSLDYVQRYKDQTLDEGELSEFNEHKRRMSMIGIGFAIMIPLQCVYVIGGKSGAYRNALASSTLFTSIIGGLGFYCGGKQNDFQKSMANKYFKHLDD